MPIFSCFLPKEGSKVTKDVVQLPSDKAAPAKAGASQLQTVNERFLELLHSLSNLDGGGLPLLFEACRATCEHLEAEQVCVLVLGSDRSATVVACAGVDGELALGRRPPMPMDSQSCSLTSTVLQMYEAFPTMPIIFRDAVGRDPPIDASPHSWTNGRAACSQRLPGEWQHLRLEHNCRQFAAVAMVASGAPIGVLSIAAKGPARPASWTPEVLQSMAVLLAGHVQQQQAHVMVDALHQLHTATTISQLVAAVGEAAVEASTAVAHVDGQARVAFLQPDASAAAIFQQQHTSEGTNTGMASPLKAFGRRASCEYVMSKPGSRKSVHAARASMDAAAFSAAYAKAAVFTAAEGSHRNSEMAEVQPLTVTQGRARMSFTMPSDKGASCKGHTLPISGTLLAEALSREAAGLCVNDCASYVQDKKAFPRDTVLSRDAVMPLSLALATISPDGKPLLALYLAYSCLLPQTLLQAVVQGLRQLLQAMIPIIKFKIEGELKSEWDYLRSQLEETARRKGYGDQAGGLPGRRISQSDSDYASSVTAADCYIGAVGPGAAGGGGGMVKGEFSPEDVSFAFNEQSAACQQAASSTNEIRSETSAGSPSPCTTLASPASLPPQPFEPGSQQRRPSLLGPARSEEPCARPNSALRRMLGIGPNEGHQARAQSAQAGWLNGSDSDSSALGLGRQTSQTNQRPAHHRLMGAVRSVSFRLEAARSPRGASRLAPIITIMHERLKAAQAAQMTGGRSEARQADLQSLKLMQEIGKGGYGTVYRGTYHGSEVAIKVIQEKELAALQSVNGDIHAPSAVVLHKQHLHDAIELVASVSVSHPNIVQVLTFFTDCKLQLPDSGMLFDSMDMGDQPGNGGARLVQMPSLLESPAPGQDIVVGGISVALVMEFMDAGSLCDAIQKRVFFERLDANGAAGGRAGKGLLAVSMRSVYSTLLEVALALRHMHSLHLVHCDLKPQNVLLKSAPRDPRGFTAKLSDFGLAKTLAHNEEGQLVIDEAVGSGTITHIAPEVFMGKKTLGAAVDIYAFGVIMYQVLCGMRLYDGLSAQEIANAVSHRMLRPALPQWVPANYRGLAERCWHQLPSVRPTAEELVRQLEKLSDFKRRNQRPQSGYQQ